MKSSLQALAKSSGKFFPQTNNIQFGKSSDWKCTCVPGQYGWNRRKGNRPRASINRLPSTAEWIINASLTELREKSSSRAGGGGAINKPARINLASYRGPGTRPTPASRVSIEPNRASFFTPPLLSFLSGLSYFFVRDLFVWDLF